MFTSGGTPDLEHLAGDQVIPEQLSVSLNTCDCVLEVWFELLKQDNISNSRRQDIDTRVRTFRLEVE